MPLRWTRDGNPSLIQILIHSASGMAMFKALLLRAMRY